MEVHAGKEESGTTLFEAERPYRCCAGCCCCQQEMIVKTGGTKIGRVYIPCYFCCPKMTVEDAQGNTLYDIGNSNPCPCCRYKMDVKDTQGNEVREVSKKWGGFSKEVCAYSLHPTAIGLWPTAQGHGL